MDNAKTAKRYADALQLKDLEATARLLSPDVEVHYPQSGEVFRGRDNYIAMLSEFPSGLPEANVPVVSGDQGTVVTSPVPFGVPLVSVVGSGEVWVIEGTAKYEDGSEYRLVAILHMGNGLVERETWYWGPPFPAPEWREPFTE